MRDKEGAREGRLCFDDLVWAWVCSSRCTGTSLAWEAFFIEMGHCRRCKCDGWLSSGLAHVYKSWLYSDYDKGAPVIR